MQPEISHTTNWIVFVWSIILIMIQLFDIIHLAIHSSILDYGANIFYACGLIFLVIYTLNATVIEISSASLEVETEDYLFFLGVLVITS